MNVLILGGTGAMGSHLVSLLANATGGYKIYCTSRQARKNSDNVQYLKGNAHDLDFISKVLSANQWDAIVDFMSYSTREFQDRVNILLDGTKHYIYLSSARVYAESQQLLTEDSPRLLDVCKDTSYLSTDEYALKKARQENFLRTSEKTNWTIVRPYVTFSEYRLQLSPLEKEFWLYRALNRRTIVFSKELANKTTTFTYGYDVARGIASLIGKKEAFAEAFHIVGNETYKWSDILEIYLDALEHHTGIRPKVMMLEEWKPFLGGNRYQVKWDRLYNRTFDNSKINKFIDTSSFKPIRESLFSCVASFIGKPQYKPIRWDYEARKDILTGEKASMKEISGVRQKIKYYWGRMGLQLL